MLAVEAAATLAGTVLLLDVVVAAPSPVMTLELLLYMVAGTALVLPLFAAGTLLGLLLAVVVAAPSPVMILELLLLLLLPGLVAVAVEAGLVVLLLAVLDLGKTG